MEDIIEFFHPLRHHSRPIADECTLHSRLGDQHSRNAAWSSSGGCWAPAAWYYTGVIDAISFCLVLQKQMHRNAVNVSTKVACSVYERADFMLQPIFLLCCSISYCRWSVQRDATTKRGSRYANSVCLSVCLTVRLHTRRLCQNCVT